MKKHTEPKSLAERIRDFRQSEEKKESRRAAQQDRRAERSIIAGRLWATEKGDVQTLESLERALKSQPWNAQYILARHKIGDWDAAAFAKGAVEVYRAACAEVEVQ